MSWSLLATTADAVTPVAMVGGADARDVAAMGQPDRTTAATPSSSFDIAFTPKAAGLRTATVTVSDGRGRVRTFAVQGTGGGL